MALNQTATVTINCDNIACISFVDTTGAYSLSNTGGYNSPNTPALSAITEVAWVLTDDDGDHVFSTNDPTYFPNSSGDNEICLTADDFGITILAGEEYTLEYTVTAGGIEYSPAPLEYTQPCCGGGVTTNLATNFSIQESIGNLSIVFTDTTGLYNASTNPGGYGTPNPAYADIDSTLITFVLSNGDTVNITDFIPTADVPYVTITAAELGYSGTITDQIATVTYSVYIAGECRVGYKSTGVLLYGKTEACINDKIATLLNNDCSCSDDSSSQTDQIMQMLFELDAIKIVAQGNIGCADGKIESLYLKCSSGCSDC